MIYIGGKHRQGKIIAEFAHGILTPKTVYVEPFCGGLGSAVAVAHNRMILSDNHKALILMWKHFCNGGRYPGVVTEAQYNRFRSSNDQNNWMTAYVGHGLSYSGKFFGAFARFPKYDKRSSLKYQASKLNRSIQIKVERLQGCDVDFLYRSYEKLSIPSRAVVYADPPYVGKYNGYGGKAKFDHVAFWNWCRRVSLKTPMLITEFNVPRDFVVLHEFGETLSSCFSKYGSKPRELLVCHKSQKGLWK